MPTGYTQQIIDGTVKTPKEFLHLCLRNFGVCISMRDMPLDTPQVDYTEYIKKYYQDTMGYYTKALENAKKELGIKARRIGNSWYWDLDKAKPE